MSKRLTSVACVLLLAPLVRGANYRVDFDGGDDTRDGRTPAAAFQHCPGDPAASGAAATVTLQPGDTVRFKGGVVYRGMVTVSASGTAKQPLVFDGNTDDAWGQGRAVVDGGDPLAGWRRCVSAEEVRGNPRWAEMFILDVPQPRRGHSLNLCTAATALPTAQHPNPHDPFWQEDTSHFLVAATTLESNPAGGLRLTDPANLQAPDADAYSGMTFAFHAGNNRIHYLPVQGFEPATGSLLLPSFKDRQYAKTRYSLLNSVRLIDQPGEYSVEPSTDSKTARIFLLPPSVGAEPPTDIVASVRNGGFTLSGASHVMVQGFLLRRQNGSALSAEGPARGIRFRDCEATLVRGNVITANRIDDMQIERGFVHHNPGHSKGILLRNCTAAVTRDCRLIANTSTAIDYYGCTNGLVVGNIVLEHRGSHANGLTFYLGCRDIRIARNRVADGKVALTFQSGEGFVICSNLFDGGGLSMVVGIWPGQPLKDVVFLHNTIVRSDSNSTWAVGLFSNSRKIEGLVVENNIIDGVCSDHDVFRNATFRNNIFTRVAKDQASGPLGSDERAETDLTKLFMNPDASDFRLRPGIEVGAVIDREWPVGLE